MHQEPPHPSFVISALAQAIFDYAAQMAADDAVDEQFLRASGLHSLPTRQAHESLLALYLYAVLVMVHPSATGMEPFSEDDQNALLNAVWTCYYDSHMSLGALTPEEIQAKTEALVSRCDEIYKRFYQARFDEEDPEWGTSVIRFFLQTFAGVVDPSPRQVNTLASRLNYLVRTFPIVMDGGQKTSMKGRISRLLSHFSARS